MGHLVIRSAGSSEVLVTKCWNIRPVEHQDSVEARGSPDLSGSAGIGGTSGSSVEVLDQVR
jgi:hypothetical protein